MANQFSLKQAFMSCIYIRTAGLEDRRTEGLEDRRTGGQEERRTEGQEERRNGEK